MSRGSQCAHGNPGRYIHGTTANGDWVRFGEGSTLSAGTPRITLSHEVDSGWGTPLTWDYFGVANGDSDGVWGMGGQRFSFVSPITFAAATPYTTSYVISLQ